MVRMTGADTPPISILQPTLRLLCPPPPHTSINWHLGWQDNIMAKHNDIICQCYVIFNIIVHQSLMDNPPIVVVVCAATAWADTSSTIGDDSCGRVRATEMWRQQQMTNVVGWQLWSTDTDWAKTVVRMTEKETTISQWKDCSGRCWKQWRIGNGGRGWVWTVGNEHHRWSTRAFTGWQQLLLPLCYTWWLMLLL